MTELKTLRTYTGPTVAGGVATVECPDWCVTDHAYWEDKADDCFHVSSLLEIVPSRDRVTRCCAEPQMGVELKLHSTDKSPAAACAWLYAEDGVELDLPGVDKLLAEVDTYRAGLANLRGLLAGLDAERRAA